MYSFSKLGERLKELVFESKMSVPEICQKTGIGDTDFYRWWSNKSVPSLKNLILLADFFNCSIDFLIGRTDDTPAIIFKKDLLPFCQRLRLMIKESGKTVYQISKESKIHEQAFTRWLNGRYVPLLDNLLKIVAVLDCSIDYLIGRE